MQGIIVPLLEEIHIGQLNGNIVYELIDGFYIPAYGVDVNVVEMTWPVILIVDDLFVNKLYWSL